MRLIIIVVLFAIALALAFTQPKQKPTTLQLSDIKTETQVQYVIPTLAVAGPVFAQRTATYDEPEQMKSIAAQFQ